MGVLFTQLAVAAYACPSWVSGTEAGKGMQASSGHQAMPAGCEQLDPAASSLCMKHWQVGDQSVDHPEMSSVAPALTVLYFVTPPEAAPRPRPDGIDRDFLAHGTSPPLAIRNCCFRI